MASTWILATWFSPIPNDLPSAAPATVSFGHTPRTVNWPVKLPCVSGTQSPSEATVPLDVLKLLDAFVKDLVARIEKEGAAYDIATHRDAPPGLRIWCGCTVERSDVAALIPWIDWAFVQAKAALPKAA